MDTPYDQIASQWIDNRKQLPAKDQAMLDAFMAQLPKQAKLLDLGCGSGFPIHKQLLDNGFDTLGIDSSKALLQHASTQLLNGHFEHGDLTQIELTDSYQGIVLWDAIFHLPRQEHAPLLSKAFKALTPGGRMLLSSGGSESDIPAFTDTMFDVVFYYDAHNIHDLLVLCKSIGFQIEQFEVLNKPDGKRDKGRIGLMLFKA